MGVEECAGMREMMYAAFPDGKHTFDETYEVGDRVFSRASFSGTHKGDFMGMEAGVNLVEEGAMTEARVKELSDGMRMADEDPSTMVAHARMHQLVARKPL